VQTKQSYSLMRRKTLVGFALAAIGALAPAVESVSSLRKITFVFDDRWTSDDDVAAVLHYAGGTDRLERLGFIVEILSVRIGDDARLAQICSTLSLNRPAILVGLGDGEVRALHAAMPLVPLIYMLSIDARGSDLESLVGQPDRQLTGVTFDVATFVKPLEFLSEAVGSRLRRAAVVSGANWHTPIRRTAWLSAAKALGIELSFVIATNYAELASDPSWLTLDDIDGVIVPMSLAQVTNSLEMVRHLNAKRIPAIFERFNAVVEGAPLGYEDVTSDWRRSIGAALALVCAGVAPSEIPVRGPDNWEFAVNLKSMSELGLTASPSLGSWVSRVF
jgi:ABC-type uncharacterized transport system substrate-binding protein